jgi:hypothetical protein
VLGPLEKAAEATAQGRFEQARNHVAQTRGIPTDAADRALAEAQKAVEAVARGALRQAYGEHPLNSAEQGALIKAAQAAMKGDMAGARENAEAAGEAGQRAVQALERAAGVGVAAQDALSAPLEEARDFDRAIRAEAEESIDERAQQLRDAKERTRAWQQKAEADRVLLEQAGERLKTGQVEEGIALLHESLGGRRIAPDVERAFGKPIDEGPGVAEPPPGNQGQVGVEAARERVLGEVAAAAERAARAVGQAGLETAEIEHSLGSLEKSAEALGQDDVAGAAALARAAAGPAYAAARAAKSFEAAARQAAVAGREVADSAAPPPGSMVRDRRPAAGPAASPAAASGQAPPFDVHGEMAAAATRLEAAQGAVRSLLAPVQGAPHLEGARQNLENAVAAATHRALSSTVGSGAWRSAGLADLAGQPPEPLQEADPALAKSWDGISAPLATKDKQTRKTQYSSYYRKANQRYLEQVARAARTWQE